MAVGDELGSVDPQGIVTGLIAEQAPELAQNDTVDPQTVLNRLIRKGLDRRQQRQLERSQTPQTPSPETGAADFSSYGTPVDTSSAPEQDFSGYGTPAEDVPLPKPRPPEADTLAWSDTPAAAAKGAGRGLIDAAGSTLKGAGIASNAFNEGVTQSMEAGVDPTSGMPMPAVDMRGPNGEARKQAAPQENPLYRAGQSVQDFAERAIPASEAEKQSLSYRVPHAVAGMAPYVAGGILAPEAAVPIALGAAAQFGLAGAGDTFDEAMKKGASIEDATKAAGLSGAVGAAIGVLPLGAVLHPIQKFMPQASGWAVRALAQAGQNGLVFVGIGEAQDYLAQQIAKEFYDPKAGYSPDAKRMLESLLTGGVLGAVHGAVSGREAKQSDVRDDDADARARGGLPPPPRPDTGTGTGDERTPPPGDERAGEGGFERGSPEEREARTAKAREEGIAREKAKQEQAAAEKARKQSEGTPEQRRRKKLEELAGAHNEHSAEDIAKWDDETLKDYVNVKAGYGSSKQPDDMLRKAGVSDDEIKTMSPERKAAMVDELHNAVSSALDDEIGKINLGTRAEPIDLKTADDVRAAEQRVAEDRTPAQTEAGNAERGHATWNGLDISIEIPKGGKRQGIVKDTGAVWESDHPHPYGELLGVPKAADGMLPDVIIGDHPDAPNVYVLDELDRKTGTYKQSKSFVGFHTPDEVRASYLGISTKKAEQIGAITAVPRDQFKALAKAGGLSKPLAYQAGNKVSNEAGTAANMGDGSRRPSTSEQDTSPGELARVGKQASVRGKLPDLETDGGSLQRPGERELPLVRGKGGNGLSGVEGELPPISQGHGTQAEGSHPGPERQQTGVQPGKLPLGNEARAGSEQVEQRVSHAERQDADTEGLGNGTGPSGKTITGAQKGGLVGRADSDRATSSQQNRQAPHDRISGQESVSAGVGANNGAAAEHNPTKNEKGLAGRNSADESRESQSTVEIEEALRAAGIDPVHVRPADIAAAAEIQAHEGAPARDAFIVAVARSLAADGHIKPEDAKGILPDENVLESGEDAGGRASAQAASASARRPSAQTKEDVSASGAEVDRSEAHGIARQGAGAGDTAQGGRTENHPAGGERNAAGGAGKPADAGRESAAANSTAKTAKGDLIGDRVPKIAEHKVTAADNTTVSVTPVVVEAKDLITSNDKGYDEKLQPRDRSRAASQAQIREIKTRLNPERLGYSAEADRGAPIVGPDGMVESGNGRVTALRELYAINAPNAKKYREWLTAQGVNVAKYKEPVLVRQRTSPLEQGEREAFARAANQSATLAMSAPERAMADAKYLTPRMLGMIEDAGNLNAAANRGFIRAFVATIPASERGALTNAEGHLSAEGITRARNAVLARAYNDSDVLSRITESTDDAIKSISNALVIAAPEWAAFRADVEAGRVRQDIDLTKELVAAVKQTADLRSRGQKLADYLAQVDAFDTLPAPTEAFMRMFYDAHGQRAAGASNIADKLRFYAAQAAKVTNDPRLDLGAPEVTADEIQRAALKQEVESGRSARDGTNGGVRREEARGPRPAAGGEKASGRDQRGPERGFAEPDDLFSAEPGAEGKPQLVVPGAERVSNADIAKRRAASPLRPKVAQKPLEHGLFADRAQQSDLFDQQQKPKQAEPKVETAQARETGPSDSGVAQTAPTGKIEDFGEKIGGARKDLAAPTGERPKVEKPKDDRPTWAKRFTVQEVDVKSSTDGETGKRFEIFDERTEKPLMDPNTRWKPRTFATKEEAEQVLPLAAVAQKHRVVSGADNTFKIIRDVTERKRVTIKDGFATRDEALRYLHDHAVDILETKTGFGEEILAAPDKVKREGIKHRNGNVDERDFGDTFGFRGVEFGNWNNQTERQEVMNHAYDGLRDLADLLNVPPKALSLDGQLAIAFGARGHGLSGARAHYERDYGVINLTKMSGAGSLAHEWMHALDAYLARRDTKASSVRMKNERGDEVYEAGGTSRDYISHGPGYNSKLRAEVKAALKHVSDTIATKAETYVEDTEQADKWLGRAKERLSDALNDVRANLAKKMEYGTRNVAPADAEQLARFDGLADKLRNGDDIVTSWRLPTNGKGKPRYTNDTVEALSALYKEVRGRSGFHEGQGPIDRIVHAVNDFKKRQDMMEQAAARSEKTRRVPTQFARDAYNLDQGRNSDYWSTPHELIARAMSAYVEDKIAERGGRSDFLSYGSDNAFYRIMNARPFPEGAEREAINGALDQFFKTLNVEEGSKPGSLALAEPENRFAQPPSSEAGSPTLSAKAAETGGAPMNSSSEALGPEAVQPSGPQDSERSEPSGSLTQRYTPPSIFEGPRSTVTFSDFRLGDIDPTSNHHIIQASSDFNALHAAAEANKPKLLNRLHELADGIDGVGIYGARVKDLDGLKEKIEAKGRNPNTISDYLGARIVVDTPKALGEFIDRLKATGGVIEDEDFIGSPDAKAGYRAYHVQIGLGDGTSAELQLVPRPTASVMTEAHAIRQPVKRLLDLGGADNLAKAHEVMARQRRIYDDAWAKAPDWQDYVNRELAENEPSFNAPTFYSATARAIEAAKQEKASPNQWLGMLRNAPGVKPEEIEWLGLQGWLRDHKGPVTKQAIADYVRANQIEVREIEKGERPFERADIRDRMAQHLYDRPYAELDADIKVEVDQEIAESGIGATKFGQWQLPGGKNYRELLLTLPEQDTIVEKPVAVPSGWGDTEGGNVGVERSGDTGADYRSSHWDEPNVLAHVRFNDRTIDGKKTLFVEEVQSDWHQTGKKRGYKGEPVDLAPLIAEADRMRMARTNAVQDEWRRLTDGKATSLREAQDYGFGLDTIRAFNDWQMNDPAFRDIEIGADRAAQELDSARRRDSGRVPDAPFKTTWPELAMKRMIRHAAENGYDQLAWTPGEVQADRYHLSKQLKEIGYSKNFDGTYYVMGRDKRGDAVKIGERIAPAELSEHVGKDLADKITAGEGKETKGQSHWKTFSGVDLKVGGEGMLRFYDDILPATVNKLVKKYGAKVGTSRLIATDMPASEYDKYPVDHPYVRKNAPAVHTLTITPELRTAAMSQGFPLFEGKIGGYSSRTAASQVVSEKGVPLGQQLQRHVIHNGIATGREHLVAVGADGKVIDSSAGEKRNVAVSPTLAKALHDPSQSVVIHHNHPSNGGLSSADIAHLGLPGLAAVWAHGHGGSVVRAGLTARARSALRDLGPDRAMRKLFIATERISLPLEFALKKEIAAGKISHDEAYIALPHLVSLALERAGVIDYRSNIDVDKSIADLKLDPYIENAASAAAGSLLNAPGQTAGKAAGYDRPTEPLRHLGDVGASFEKPPTDAGGRSAPRGVDRVRRAQDQREEAGQIRLPGFADGFEEPKPRFRQPPPRYPIAETIGAYLELNNQPKLAAISGKLGLANVNGAELRVKAQDKFLRWKLAEQAVARETGKPVPEGMQTYMAESLYYGRTGQRLEKLDQQHLDPLVEDIKKRGLTLEQVDQFLYARHAVERNAKLRAINPSIANPSGMSDADARKILTDIYNSPKRGDYGAIERRVRALVDETRQTLVNGGLLTPGEAREWAKYKNYVPLRGWAEGSDDTMQGNGTGRGYDVRGPESKQALGRKSLADSPLSYVMVQAQQAIIRAEKNKVGQTAGRFVQSHPDDNVWKVDKGDTKRVIDAETGLVKTVGDQARGDNVFRYKVDGVPHYINFQGEYGENLARALNNMGTANMGSILRLFASMTRTLARLSTSWNPDFMIPNFVRDAGEAFINLQAQEQKTFVRRFVKHLGPSIGGAFNALRGKDTGPYAKAFQEFDEAGGRIRFFGMDNAEDIKGAISAKMRRLEGGVMNKARDVTDHALEAIETANGAIENATRLAAYMAARDVGLSKEKAASIARELTVNFNRKGEWGQTLSALYMFGNAALQGSTRMLQAMTSKNSRRLAYGLAAAGASLALYNIFAGGDDDDGVPYYLKVAPWERDGNMILMWPKGVGMDGHYVKIPLPYGYSFFHVIGDRMASLSLGKEKASKAFPAMAKSVLDAFDPLGKDDSMLAQIMPTFAKPAVHLGENKNWTGRPINPQKEPWNKYEPDSQRAFRSTSEFSKKFAEGLNKLSGGTKHEPGYVDLSPGTIDYALSFIGGGLGRFGLNLANTITRGLQGREWDINHTPVLHRFAGKVDDNASRALYYEARDEVKAVHDRLQAYTKDKGEAKDPANAERFRKEHKAEIDAYQKFDATDRRRHQLEKDVTEIKADKSLSAAERDAKIKVKQQEELKLMAESRKRLKEAREAQEKAKPGPLRITVNPIATGTGP